MIIGISGLTYNEKGERGSAGAGKDAVADHLTMTHGFVKVALADPLKRACREWFDFTDDQLWGPSAKRNEPDTRWPRPEEVAEAVDDNSMGGSITGYLMKGRPAEPFLTPRLALQRLGSEFGRDCSPDVWVRYAMRTAKTLLRRDYVMNERMWMYSSRRGLFQEDWFVRGGAVSRTAPSGLGLEDLPKGVVISDIRFINEIKAVHGNGGKVVRVKRKLEVLPGGAATHRSEVELSDMPDSAFDHVIDNSGDLPELYLKTTRMVDIFKGKVLPYDPAMENVPPFKRK